MSREAPPERIPDHGYCFGCGESNPSGLGMIYFRHADGSISARFTPRDAQQGAPGISHGGAVFTVLDEAMGKAVWVAGHRCLTSEVRIQFLRPARLGEELELRARVDEEDTAGTVHASAEARRPDGKVVATTQGGFRTPRNPIESVQSDKR